MVTILFLRCSLVFAKAPTNKVRCIQVVERSTYSQAAPKADSNMLNIQQLLHTLSDSASKYQGTLLITKQLVTCCPHYAAAAA
jgi:hypothetical protein